MHEWVKCADIAMGLGLWGGLKGVSKTIMTTEGSVRCVEWDGGGLLGWRRICLFSAQEKRSFEPVSFSQHPAQFQKPVST